MHTVYGVDPDETWEVDYCLESIRIRIEQLHETIANPRTKSDVRLRSQEAVVVAEREQEQYERGSGPMFLVGHAPTLKTYELMGMAAEGMGRSVSGDKLCDVYRWEREVVRWSVRGHRNLRFRRHDGSTADVQFEQSDAESGGAKRVVVADRTLEVYGASGMLGPLALMISDSQRLSESEKNA